MTKKKKEAQSAKPWTTLILTVVHDAASRTKTIATVMLEPDDAVAQVFRVIKNMEKSNYRGNKENFALLEDNLHHVADRFVRTSSASLVQEAAQVTLLVNRRTSTTNQSQIQSFSVKVDLLD